MLEILFRVKGISQGSGFRQSLLCVAKVQQHKRSFNKASTPNGI